MVEFPVRAGGLTLDFNRFVPFLSCLVMDASGSCAVASGPSTEGDLPGGSEMGSRPCFSSELR